MKHIKKISISIIIIVIIIASIIGGLFYLKNDLNGKFKSNTFIAGIDVSKKTPEQAIQLLTSKKEEILNKEIKIKTKEKTFKTKLKDFGINVLEEETVKMIKVVNSKNLSIIDILNIQNKETKIPLLITINKEILLNTIEKEFSLKEKEAKNANFIFNDSSELEIIEEKKGIKLNEKKLIKDLKELSFNQKETELELIFTEEISKITKEKLEKQKENILKQLNHQITLIDPIYSDDWFIKLSEHLDWVKFKELDGKIRIAIKQDELNKYIDEEISEWLDLPTETVNIKTNENGEVVFEGKGNDGKEIQREFLKESIEIAVANKETKLIIPVKKIKPKFIFSEDLKEKGITDRIATGHTSFYGSTGNRLHNIKTGAARFNGHIIAPGEEFSFNTVLGQVDRSTGYRQELVIKADGTKPEYGGGLCQVSTTMYRTILFSGLNTTARRPHSYAVSYYSQVMGHGLDATIYLGGQDLKFINDTKGHILIQAYTQNDYELYIVFYGTPTGKTIEMEGPYLSNYHYPGPTVYIDSPKMGPGQQKQVEVPHVGFNAVWYRHITDENGNINTDKILSAYKAIPAKILKGPAIETSE